MTKFGFDAKAPLVSKTILFGKCWELLSFPDSCTKWLYEALVKKAKAGGRENPNTEDFINLLTTYLWPDFLQEKAYFSPEEILAKLVWKIHWDYPNLSSIKELLNTIGQSQNIKFSESS